MRIKLSTSSPLTKYNCWFVLTEKNESQTVHHLRKKIVKDLELNSEPCLLQLSMDGFNLLPQSNIQGLLRDGDLINVEQVNSNKPITKKRKISSIEEKKDSSPSTVKKSKKEVPPTNQKKSEKVKEKATSKKSDKGKEKSSSKSAEKVKEVVTKTTTKSSPFEGKLSTKKRNMRRRSLKRRLRTLADPILTTESIKPTTHLIDNELQIQNLNISNAEPLQLIKKNKNKKKNHMKQMDQRSHVHYTPEVTTQQQLVTEYKQPESVTQLVTKPEMTQKNNSLKNKFGRAFVTFIESEKNYKERSNSNFNQEYPIHRMPTLFYASKEPTENEFLSQSETEITSQVVTDEQPEHVVNVVEVVNVQDDQIINEKPLNYEDFSEANFTDKLPSIGTKLAIKTLELTSTYTPEISDWKQVILKQIDIPNQQVTFEFLPGFGKATTKGGKFDNKKNRKRYDDWYEEQDEEEEEEEEEKEVTFEFTDIFAMRIMS